MQKHSDLVLGTAGHIDHGKSSLVLALTGVDPDRLAEEKRRGITIELGFARLELPNGTVLGVVDVPGHERFVRQMIAGASGIDLALLCVAADDGIMPQTEEHVAVLELLGIPACVVALTKVDLVDPEWTELMVEEVRGFMEKTPYRDAPVVCVSSVTGQGLDELKGALEETASGVARTQRGSCFRLPVDRVFSLRGSGTIVTGTSWSGTVALDDKVEVFPSGLQARVRSIQIHGEPVEKAASGHRVALNLGGVSAKDVHPGDMVSVPGRIRPSWRFDVDFTYLGAGSRRTGPLKSGARVHVAHGSKEVTGRVLFFNGRQSLNAGERAFAQIRLDEPLAIERQDRFVVRSYSPVHVIGGGTVLLACSRHSTRLPEGAEALLNALWAHDEPTAARCVLDASDVPMTEKEVGEVLGLEEDASLRILEACASDGDVRCLEAPGGVRAFCTRRTLQRCMSSIERTLLAFHADRPLEKGMSKEALRKRALPKASSRCFEALLAHAVEQGTASMEGSLVGHPKAGKGARKAEGDASGRLLAMLEEAGASPPSLAELIEASGVERSLAHRALGLLEKDGDVVRVDAGYCFSAKALERCRTCVEEALSAAPATVAELRDALGVSRKYALMLLEYFDEQGVTRREGDVRVLGA